MAGKNEYSNIVELVRDYYDQPTGTYLNQTITVDESTLTCDIYRVANETVLTSAIFTGCIANDANTQIIIGKNMSVADGTTLTPPYRCKGVFIGDVGTFTNEGTISMTARGASATGADIPLYKEYEISAIGGSGGASRTGGNGYTGGSPTTGVLSCGGGGSGASGRTHASGRGGNGTSFSGGAGSGGAGESATSNGSDTGGAGSKATNGLSLGSSSGGVGNPGGNDVLVNQAEISGVNGTGGLIVILATQIDNQGSVVSNGSTPHAYSNPNSVNAYGAVNGGSSGGGCVVVITREAITEGTLTANGGASAKTNNGEYGRWGGAGGNGTSAIFEEEDLILINLPFQAALTDTEHFDNVAPTDGARILGLMDKDELMYEYAGERHRAMDTNATFGDCMTRGEQVPDEIEVNISSPQDGQLLKYNATSQKWENGDDYHVYSTDERVVGTWIDGRPVYEKTINTSWSEMTSVTTYRKQYPILNIAVPIYIRAINLANNETFQGNLTTASDTGEINTIWDISYKLSTNGIDVFVGKSMVPYVDDFIFTVQYTKTTDTPTVQS